MGQEIIYCPRCQTRLTGGDIEKGKTAATPDGVCCITCLTPLEVEARRKRRETEARKAPAPKSGVDITRASGTKIMRQVPPPEPAAKSRLQMILGVVGGLLLVLIGGRVVFSGGRSEPAPVTRTPATVDAPKAPPAAAPVAVPVAPPPVVPVVPPAGLAGDLEGLAAELMGLLSKNNFGMAQAVLERARSRHAHPEWSAAVGAMERDLRDQVRSRFEVLKKTASEAAAKQSVAGVRAALDEIYRWGPAFEGFVGDFNKQFDGVLAAPAPGGEPLKPPLPDVPAPPPAAPVAAATPDPGRSEAARKYIEPWEKAMFLATRLDYDRAGAELQRIRGDFLEEDVRKEIAADLGDLERLRSMRAKLLEFLSKLAAGEKVEFEVIGEDGSRSSVEGRIISAASHRLELLGGVRFVEIEDIGAASLLRMFVQKRKKPSSEEGRVLAVLCALDGDAKGALEHLGGAAEGLAPKYWNYANTVRGRLPPVDGAVHQSEWTARKLYYAAESEFPVLDSRSAAVEKYQKLLEGYAETSFLLRTREEIKARIDQCLESTYLGMGLRGKGIFKTGKLDVELQRKKVEMYCWVSTVDLLQGDVNNYSEVTFFALPNTGYKGWALVGGCCATTYSWHLQGNELVYADRKSGKDKACEPGSNLAAPWEHKVKGLTAGHGGKDHAKAPKEPSKWAWAELPIPKYAAGGVKSIRLMGFDKGMAVAAVCVSARRDKPPDFEEMKKLAEAAALETPPLNALRAGKDEMDLLFQIPEAKSCILVYDLDLAKLRRPVQYDVDNRAAVKAFDRVAYLMELQPTNGPYQYVFVSMNAFTDDPARIGVPDEKLGTQFQQKVASMNVYSNVEGVVNGTGLDGGNIEFWPQNYATGNSAKVPGANDGNYDFGDQPANPGAGHGSMQVHNHAAGHTLFSINKWHQGGSAEIGIGSSKTGNPDWTFIGNAGSYSHKRLRVLVRPRR